MGFRAIALSPDGTLLAGKEFNSLTLWSLATGKQTAEYTENSTYTRAFTVNSNNELVSVTQMGDVRWWDVAQQKVVRSWNCLGERKKLAVTANAIHEAAFSADAKVLVAHLGHAFGGHVVGIEPDKVLVAWDTTTGKELWRKDGDEAGTHLVFSADGKSLAYSTWSDEIRICGAATGKDQARLTQGKNPLEVSAPVAASPDGKTVAVGGRKFALWDVTGRLPLRELNFLGKRRVGFGIKAAFSPDGKSLMVAVDGHLQLFDVASGSPRLLQDGHREPVSYLAFSSNGRSINTGSSEEWSQFPTDELLNWDLATGKVIGLSKAKTLVKKLNVRTASEDHKRGLVLNGGGAVFVDLTTGKKLGKPQLIDQDPRYAPGYFSPLGRYFVSRPNDNSPSRSIFDTGSGKELCKVPRAWTLGDLTFSTDENQFARMDDVGVVHIADVETGRIRFSLGQPFDEIGHVSCCLKFSPDGKYLACWTSNTNDVRIWDLAKRKEIHCFVDQKRGRNSREIQMCWSADGRMLADVGIAGGNVIRIWETTTGKLRRQIKGHVADIEAIAFSPDSRLLASGSADTTVLIWNLASVEP